MLRTLATLLLTVAAQQPQTPTPIPASSPTAALDAKLQAAANDPALVVPLILDTSEQLSKLDGDSGRRHADALEGLLHQVFFSGRSYPGEEQLGIVQHVVQKGELPGSIAKRYRIGAGMLRYMNEGYDERRIAAGRKLRVLDLSNQSLQLIVDKERFRLGAWYQTPSGRWSLAMYVPVGLGAADSPTPSGTSKIVDRVRDPAWTDPKTHEVFPPKDPRNVLGGYWIKLDSDGIGKTGIGLHGYTGSAAPDWIEKGSSNGCVRMLQSDVDRVFELALEGTKVVLAP